MRVDLPEVWELLAEYYPEGHAWEAAVDEHIFGELDQEAGCEVITGIAVDRDGDERADLFLYSAGLGRTFSITSSHLTDYLVHSECPPDKDWRGPQCDAKVEDTRFIPIPFAGELLPDSYGKITGLMFVAHPLVENLCENF